VSTFRPFSFQHAAVIFVFAAACTLAIRSARRAKPGTRVRVEHTVGWLSLMLFLIVNTELWLFTDRFDAKQSLPLHVCDLALVVVPIVLIRSTRVARTVLYYFGLGLSTQGFFTPDLEEGPEQWEFWSFWLLHFAVVGTAVYDLGARRFRPRWRDFRDAVIVGLAYVALVLSLDVAFDWNYGYVGAVKPEKPTLIDALGPWPWRVGIIMAMTAAVFALMTVPFSPSPWKGEGRGEG
jgi:hypothetical integral membrane protein (TIGR02206 family)